MSNAEHYPPEKEFLLTLALNQYNSQFKKNLLATDCEIHSIAPSAYTDRGYEITTIRQDDSLVLKMFLTFSSATRVDRFIVEAESDPKSNKPLSQTLVLTAELDSYFIEQDIYKFRDI